ncbi:hypothetical protein K1719_014338 [Acacia pycnantha]|nr:hypothetical protein K1719_014338 [Acacia pycnantha]
MAEHDAALDAHFRTNYQKYTPLPPCPIPCLRWLSQHPNLLHMPHPIPTSGGGERAPWWRLLETESEKATEEEDNAASAESASMDKD